MMMTRVVTMTMAMALVTMTLTLTVTVIEADMVILTVTLINDDGNGGGGSEGNEDINDDSYDCYDNNYNKEKNIAMRKRKYPSLKVILIVNIFHKGTTIKNKMLFSFSELLLHHK